MREIKNLEDLSETLNALKKRAVVLDVRISRILSQSLTAEQLEEVKKDFVEYSEVTKKIQLLESKERMIYHGLAYPNSMDAHLRGLSDSIEEITKSK